MHIRIFLYLIYQILLTCFLYETVSAVGFISNTDLRLEFLLATGSADTSKLSRIVTSVGVILTYLVGSFYGMPNVRFTGRGWLKVNTS